MKNKAVTPTDLKSKSAETLAAKTTEAQAARLAAHITAREAEAAKQRANGAKIKFKSAKKAWRLARKAAKRATKRAKQAREQLTVLNKKLKPSKKKTAAKPLIRGIKPAVKRKLVKRKRPAAVITPLPARDPGTLASPASPAAADDASVA